MTAIEMIGSVLMVSVLIALVVIGWKIRTPKDQ